MHDQKPVADLITAIAADQHGAVHRQQLLEAGVTARKVDGLIRRRWLRPAVHGVYLVGAAPPPLWRESAVLLANPAAVLSHWTAARLVRLEPHGAGDIVHILVPRGSSGRSPGVIAVRTDRLFAAEWRFYSGLRATTPARTLLDLAVELGRGGETRRLEQMVARALDEKLCTGGDIRAVLRRHVRTRGAGLLQLVLGDDGRPALTRSEAEERLRQHLVDAQVLPWLHNTRVAGYEVDFLWKAQRLIVEVDGYGWHSSRNRFQGDRARDAALVAAGYLVLRFTWEQIDEEPMAVVARIAFVLGLRSAA